MLIILLAATVASLAATPAVIRLAGFLGLYDQPVGGRRVHRAAVPRLGGIAVFTATLIGLGVAALSPWGGSGIEEIPRFYLGVLTGGAILFGVGLVDDVRGLAPSTKLVWQFGAAGVAYAFGFRLDALSLGASHLELGLLSLPLTLLWVVGVTNAFNLIDGLDGLATGVALVALGTILAVSLLLGRPEVALVLVALIGALLGFLRYNFNPARIFLGDSGTLFVGYMLAVLSVHGSVKSATAVLAIVPLFALALPLLDTGLAVARRWLRGAPVFGADGRHIHHQLLARGLTTRRAVLLLYVVTMAFAAAGVLLAFSPPPAVAWTAMVGGVASAVLLVGALRHLDYHEFDAVRTVLVTGPAKLRKVLSDRIHARDVAGLIRAAGTLDEVNAILEDSLGIFRFTHMEVCGVGSLPHPAVMEAGRNARAWKLDFPVAPGGGAVEDWYVLRIWCLLGDDLRPYGADRVAGILGPAIGEWMRATEWMRVAEWMRPADWMHAAEPRELPRVYPGVVSDEPRRVPALHMAV